MDASAVRDMNKIYDRLGRGPLEIGHTLDPATFDLECEKIFKRSWLMVGRLEDLPNAGDYKVKQIAAGKTSAIIIRGKDGAVRAFHNICTHRGNKVIPETGPETMGRARGNSLTCRFHGWVFDTAGAVRMIPQEGLFPEPLDKSCLGLPPIACDTWEGFIFINLAKKPAQSLHDYLGDFAGHMAGYPYHESTFARRYSVLLDCNWKVAVDAFSEGYHVETIHAATLPGVAGVKTEHTDFAIYGPHSSSGYYVPGASTMKPTPVEANLGARLRNSIVHGPHNHQLPASVNRTRRNDFMFEFAVLGPNTVLHLCVGNAYPSMTFFHHQFWPISHNRTLWEGTNFYRPATKPSELIAQVHTDTLHRNAWLEDTSTMEDTYAGLLSGAIDKVHLMDHEVMIRNSQHAIREMIHAQ